MVPRDYLPGLAVAARCGVTVLRRVGKSKVAVRCPFCGRERWVTPEAMHAWVRNGKVPDCERVRHQFGHCRGEPAATHTEGGHGG